MYHALVNYTEVHALLIWKVFMYYACTHLDRRGQFFVAFTETVYVKKTARLILRKP